MNGVNPNYKLSYISVKPLVAAAIVFSTYRLVIHANSFP
jgi:hypothetical protein